MPLAAVDPHEQALIETLTALRMLVEEEYALDLERSAAISPLVFEAAEPSAAAARRSYVFRIVSHPAQADGARLKVGDSVDVLAGQSGLASGLFGALASLTPSAAVVEFGRPVALGDLPPTGRLRLHVDDNQRTIRLRAIERVVRERHQLSWVATILTTSDVAPLATVASASQPAWAVADLTPGQRRALDGAARSRDVFLVQGPPGTGKTTVIAALARYFAVERGARVLLTSKGHRAIDNALDRLGGGDLHLVRLGQSDRVTGAGQQALLAELLARAEQEVPRRHLAVRGELADLQRSLNASEQLLAELDTLNAGIADSQAALAQRIAEIEASYASGLEAVRRLGLRVEPEPAPAADGSAASSASGLTQTRGAPRRVVLLNQAASSVRRVVGRLRRSAVLSGKQSASQASGVLPGKQSARQALYRDAESWVAERRRRQLGRPDLAELRDAAAELSAQRGRLMTRAAALLPRTSIDVAGVHVPPLIVATPEATRASLRAARLARQAIAAALPVLEAWGTLLDRPGALAGLLVETADVVAATAVGVNSGRDGARTADLDFDVAIVDEAGQAQLTDLVVPLSRTRTVVLVGDHQQLPPYVDDDLLRRCKQRGIPTAHLETSLFEQLWQRVPPTHRARLDVQFRMPRVIAQFLSQALYDGELASAANKQGDRPICGLFRSAVVFVDTSAEPDRHETAVSTGFVNRREARLLADIAARVPPSYLAGEGSGVIAPYAAQVASIRQALAAALALPPRDPWLVDNVATVDSFQGQERDLILVSLTRSNTDGSVGFLNDLKRLNVTLSRAREQLVIIGDLSTLCVPGGGAGREALARFIGGLADHIRQHGELLEVRDLQRRLDA